MFPKNFVDGGGEGGGGAVCRHVLTNFSGLTKAKLQIFFE
jgi:hypothetical protein